MANRGNMWRGLAVVMTIGVAGCDFGAPVPEDAAIDAFVRPDANSDAPVPGDAGARSCSTDLECPPGVLCLGGICQADPCATDDPCGEGERCRATCVALTDPCEGVVCGTDETCIDGTCFPGCLRVVCEGVVCPDGQFCDPSRGLCTDVVSCGSQCGEGFACHTTCTPRSACEGIRCEESEFCRAGECLPNPCFGVACARGSVCQNGSCVATCNCDPACEAPSRCVGGVCVCTPRCSPDAQCGDPDGCGGFCVGACEATTEECNPDTGLCECIPSCPDEAACGEDDGCGGRCDGPCADGRTCVEGACTCLDECLAPSMVECGAPIPDTCMASIDCMGQGSRCESGATCLMDACCPACPAASAVACGDPIADSVDPLGRTCADCTGVGSACPPRESCLAPPGRPAPTDRVCCGACAPASSVPCGSRIPDVLDADGSVCRVCTGYGTAGCETGSTCTGGASGMCCEACASASSIECGEAVPSPDCRTCTGVGTRCDARLSCVNPPGTTSASDRVCCGSCPAASTVACGAPIPDVMSDGTVCRDCGTGTACAAGSTCVDGACCPSCPAASTVACGTEVPPRTDSLGRECRTCSAGTMCATGRCSGGSCCASCAAPSTLACGFDPEEAPGCPMCANGTRCPVGERCRSGECCAPTCAPPSTRPCGETPSDGCGGTCAPGTACDSPTEACAGSPLRCTACTPSCVGRVCGQSDGCGGECSGRCDPGFVCSERPAPAAPGDFECEASACVPSCGLCQSCVLGTCEPLACAPGTMPCLFSCECCGASEACTPTGCAPFG
ncbi:MAG: hypothetical protein J0L92_08325 [Deltaproteobacteria bacterium]|nr:hypothetical protein [Deltaproteobacteria bacterium]